MQDPKATFVDASVLLNKLLLVVRNKMVVKRNQ